MTPAQAADLLVELESNAFDGQCSIDIGEAKGAIVFREGSILQAKLGSLDGRLALLRILTALQSRWTLLAGVVREGVPIATSINALLSRDESRQLQWNDLCAHSPPLGATLQLSSAGKYVRDGSVGYQSSLLNLVDGRRTLMQVLEDGTLDPIDTLQQLLDAIRQGLVQPSLARNSLFPLAATEESSGFMPRLSPVTVRQAGSGSTSKNAAAVEPWHPINNDDHQVDAPIANSNAAHEAPLSEPYLAPTPLCIGRYEILMRIGSGAVGTVYLCRTQSEQTGFRRLFALKLLRSHLSGDASATREFLEEARIAGVLHHTNVVGVLDAGFHGHRPYLVMDYVEGCSLRQLMKGWPGRSPFFLLPIIIDALAGLDAVHSLKGDSGEDLNLVHCDISPENLLIGVDGACRLTDFGFTRRASRDNSAVARGKLGYVAPEKLAGDPFDQRADLFAMGVVLWNCLTGKSLFAATSIEERLAHAPKISVVPPSELGAESSGALDQIIMRALSRDPAERFATAEDMLTELRGVAATGQGVATTRDIAAWVRETAGRELALRRLSIIDASRRNTVTTRDFPSSGLLRPAEPAEDNLPIQLTRLSSRPPTLVESNASGDDTELVAQAAIGKVTEGSEALCDGPSLLVAQLFYSIDDEVGVERHWSGARGSRVGSSSQRASAPVTARSAPRGRPNANWVLLISVALTVACLIGYALTDALSPKRTVPRATPPALLR